MHETILQETNNMISNYIEKIIIQLANNEISPSDLPIQDMKELIIEHFYSSSQYLDPTAAFHKLISHTFDTLRHAVQQEDSTMCSNILNLLSSQIHSFVLLETSWLCTLNYNNRIDESTIYSMKQWELHTLPRFSHPSPISTSGKGCIYTAVTGGYDNILSPQYINPNLDYICFTDNPDIQSDIWDIRLIDNSDNLDPIRLARKHKILCNEYLSNYDYSIWVDGKIMITGNLLNCIQLYSISSPMLCMPHYERNCAYDEAEACIDVSKGNPEEIKRQIDKYQSESYPEHNGLIDSCVLVRMHNNDLLNTMLQTWWNEVLNESTRDQLSFGYSCWKTGFEYDMCNFSVYNNPYFSVKSHNT